MEIFRDYINCNIRNAVLTVGMFDGVHAGHRKIIEQIVRESQRVGGESTLLTFWPHPRLFFANSAVKLLTTIDEKIELLRDCGLQNLVICKFDEAFANMSPEEYVERVLVDSLHIRSIIIGYDHRFGRRGEGSLSTLVGMSARYGFDVKEISALTLNDVNVSSTKVRKTLSEGNVELANKYLTYEFSVEGRVVSGRQIGRTIGFPTANIVIDEPLKIVPRSGVYVVRVDCRGERFRGIANIGSNPTVSDANLQTIEVNLFDFNQNIYDERLRIYFVCKLRDEVKFPNIGELKNQISQDVARAREYFLK